MSDLIILTVFYLITLAFYLYETYRRARFEKYLRLRYDEVMRELRHYDNLNEFVPDDIEAEADLLHDIIREFNK